MHFCQMEHLIIELSGFLASPSQTWPNLSKKKCQTVLPESGRPNLYRMHSFICFDFFLTGGTFKAPINEERKSFKEEEMPQYFFPW